MVETHTIDQLNTRRLVLDIRRHIEQLMGAYIFEPVDSVAEGKIRNNIHSLCDHYLDRGVSVKLKPDREELRQDMTEPDKIIDVLKEEIEFKGRKDNNVINFDILICPPRQIETVEVQFTIK